MTLANPLALLWLLLAVPIIWLWLRKAPPPREVVATGAIWQEALAVERLRAKWQRWRRPASLAVRLLALLLLVLALADPRTRLPQRIVLVLDNSASMNASDATPTRWAAAQEAARQIIDSLHDDDVAAVVTAGGPAAVRCGLTADRELLRDAVENAPAGAASTEMTSAVDLARRLVPDNASNRIVVLSDGCFPAAAELARRDGICLLPFGKRTGNIAVTRLAARSCATASRATAVPAALNDSAGQEAALCQVFVELRSFCDRAVKCRLRIESQEKSIELPPDGRWQEVREVPVPASGRISARLESPDVPAAGGVSSVDVEGLGTNIVRTPPRFDVQEFDLRVPEDLGGDAAAFVSRPAGPPLWLFLLAAGGLLIGVEWCLVQRRWLD